MSTGSKLVWALGSFALILVVMIVIAIANSGDENGPLSSLSELEDEGVIEIEDEHLFLVYNDGEVLALSDDPQHLPNEHTEWCESSQLFETPTHGEKFDRLGNYYAGPAMKGLDRYPVAVEGDAIYVDLERLVPGPERGAETALEPEGPFCHFD
jgi:nitrite reductase/ring-hydroxylating ferredoxin subunit